jgi:hypothetical protein
MTPTHTDVTRAMFAASVAMGELISTEQTPETIACLAVLADALRMACDRLNAIEAAAQYKGWQN